ncbi:DUF4436 family protein [Streptomyces capitiformicae]|uniref:DUF4436 family protein n=1 Tax=Streptomyces capitiformicae TaxID=2014920 RepID=UPI001674BADC|nr:DUF4436 family protein [Streptomyces capitiformicae]
MLIAAGVWLYTNEGVSHQGRKWAGVALADRARMSLYAFVKVQKVDLGDQQLVVNLTLEPAKGLAKETRTGDEVFAQDVRLKGTYRDTETILLTKGSSAQNRQYRLPIIFGSGPISDYPFDEYGTVITWTASTSDGNQLPVATSFESADPFLAIDPIVYDSDDPESVGLRLQISRSRSTLILACFMMVAMWALAIAVLAGARVLVRRHEGLIWPALGWMAATLFALVGFRNAAPGSPPIGSLMDYAAFFWAEGIIAASLTWAAMVGFRDEQRKLGHSNWVRPVR